MSKLFDRSQGPEILSPAGSKEAVRAAVLNGADAVYMGYGRFNARRGAHGFTPEEINEAISYCRARGVKTHITANTLIGDREMPQFLQDVRFLVEAGADAFIVQDLGAARAIMESCPDVALHASTQMTVHSLEGALFAKSLGFSRVVLSRELSFGEIQYITENAGIETEVFVHGALCMCYSGQCYMSAVIGKRSGNRGLCAQPCRLSYAYGASHASKPLLSLKDLNLVSYLSELSKAGVSSLKIEGRMKRAEYVAIVTGIYASVLKEQREPTKEELETLRLVFSRDGFTQGYFLDKKGPAMFGTKTQVPLEQVKGLYEQAARGYDKEKPIVPVHMGFIAVKGEKTGLNLFDEDGRRVVSVTGDAPEKAERRPATREGVEGALKKTGGTPFFVKSLSIVLDDGLAIPASALNKLRREALDQYLAERAKAPLRRWNLTDSPPALSNGAFRGYTVQVRELSQVTQSMLRCPPAAVYAPLQECVDGREQVASFLEKGAVIIPVLPRIVKDEEEDKVLSGLILCRSMGVKEVLCGTVGEIGLVKRIGLQPVGDFGLNVWNGKSLAVLQKAGVMRQTLSFELKFAQIRDMDKPVSTELFIYGRLPLMVFENCVIRGKNGGACSCVQGRKDAACSKGPVLLTDRTGKSFPVFKEPFCRNTLYNAQPLYLGGKEREYRALGVDYGRILLTDETPALCERIYAAHLSGEALEFPGGSTRGLYYRGAD